MQVKQDPKQTAKQIQETIACSGVTVSADTISRRLREKGFRARVQRTKPMLTRLAAKKRLAFAKEYLMMPMSFWRKVIFSDESKFELVSNKWRSPCRRLPHQAYNRRMVKAKVKHSKYIMV